MIKFLFPHHDYYLISMAVRRKYTPREMRLISEYIMDAYPIGTYERYWIRMRMGTYVPEWVPKEVPEPELRIFYPKKRWADAVVVTKTEIHVIEAAIELDLRHVGALEGYLRLVPHTPELKPYLPRPIKGILVYAYPDPIAISMARDKNMLCVEYKPAWITQKPSVLRQWKYKRRKRLKRR